MYKRFYKLLGFISAISVLFSVFQTFCFAEGEVSKAYLWPVPATQYITQYCGENGHKGIDIATFAENPEIVAARAGKVTESCPTSCSHIENYPDDTCKGGKGNFVTILHADGTYATYMHLKYDTITVAVGDTVKAGDVLGIMGASGLATGVHLHFQLNSADGNVISTNPDDLEYVYSKEELDDITVDYEIWKVNSEIGLNVRMGAGTDYSKIGIIPNGTIFAITETKTDSEFTWGKILYSNSNNPELNGGWCVLDYADFVKKVSAGTGNIDIGDSDTPKPPIIDDTEKPVISEFSAQPVSNYAYNIKCKISDESLDNIKIVSWAYADPDNQIDIWIDADERSERFDGENLNFNISIGNYNGASGKYFICIYAYDSAENSESYMYEFDINYMPGDINGDEIIDISDVALARAHIVGNIILDNGQVYVGDIKNNDKIIDISDVVALRNIVVNS